jgi:para-aminobenzoate synthetase component I
MVSEDAILNRLPSVRHISSEPLDMNEPFMSVADRFAHLPGTVVLMSGGDLDCARYHILAVYPWLSFKGKGNHLQLSMGEDAFIFEADPMATLKKILAAGKYHPDALLQPVQAGLFGYLAYDLKDHLEKLPRTTLDDLHLPEICFYAPSLILVEDRVTKSRLLHRVGPDGWDGQILVSHYHRFKKTYRASPVRPASFEGIGGTLQSSFSKSDYLSALGKIHEYIVSGDIYQVNMSQRFSMGYKGSGFALFRRLFDMNPAPFFAYIHAGEHEIVSTSPERFLHRNGRRLETRPIKGTRKRGVSRQEDQTLRRELIDSPKEDAELSMIVDLMRNDLGRVCRQGSVRVVQHKRVEAYENVFHLVSIVTGELADGKDAVDVIAATFPGGSITGCPKVRAMEIIDELEPTCRHLYTGAIGYISFHKTMDLSIAIRTAVLSRGRIHFGVGGGIVFDSRPIDEFEETLHKGKTLMAACLNEKKSRERSHKRASEGPFVWFNGTHIPADRATVPVMDSGFQYGNGFFETIRAENGEPLRLESHIERFEHTWKALYADEFPKLGWKEIIFQVLEENRLTTGTAAVKIITAQAESDRPPYHPHLVITARAYTHRLKLLGKKGLSLGIYPHPRQSPLADHKTLNYLYYFQAGQWARDNRFDEALILNPDGTLSETNTGNIFIIRGKTLIEPLSPHVLPGVMAAEFRKNAVEAGFDIIKKPFSKQSVRATDQGWVTNALMGAVPVIALEGVRLAFSEDL